MTEWKSGAKPKGKESGEGRIRILDSSSGASSISRSPESTGYPLASLPALPARPLSALPPSAGVSSQASPVRGLLVRKGIPPHRGSRQRLGYEAAGTSSSARPSRVSLCPHSHWKTACLERHSSSEPRRTNFSRHSSQIRTICSAERCMRASSSLCGVTFVSAARCLGHTPMLTSHIRESGTRSTPLYFKVLVLDAKLSNRFSVVRRKLEFRYRLIEGYELGR